MRLWRPGDFNFVDYLVDSGDAASRVLTELFFIVTTHAALQRDGTFAGRNAQVA